jgi:hypothetical protein
MSARKSGDLGTPQASVSMAARQARLSLPRESVVIHKNGIEFHSPTPFAVWREMTVALQTPDNGEVHCTGVVVNCAGNKHAGWHVSMVFTDLSRQAQARLTSMASATRI